MNENWKRYLSLAVGAVVLLAVLLMPWAARLHRKLTAPHPYGELEAAMLLYPSQRLSTGISNSSELSPEAKALFEKMFAVAKDSQYWTSVDDHMTCLKR